MAGDEKRTRAAANESGIIHTGAKRLRYDDVTGYLFNGGYIVSPLDGG